MTSLAKSHGTSDGDSYLMSHGNSYPAWKETFWSIEKAIEEHKRCLEVLEHKRCLADEHGPELVGKRRWDIR